MTKVKLVLRDGFGLEDLDFLIDRLPYVIDILPTTTQDEVIVLVEGFNVTRMFEMIAVTSDIVQGMYVWFFNFPFPLLQMQIKKTLGGW